MVVAWALDGNIDPKSCGRSRVPTGPGRTSGQCCFGHLAAVAWGLRPGLSSQPASRGCLHPKNSPQNANNSPVGREVAKLEETFLQWDFSQFPQPLVCGHVKKKKHSRPLTPR